jgi:hypothetical protein
MNLYAATLEAKESIYRLTPSKYRAWSSLEITWLTRVSGDALAR